MRRNLLLLICLLGLTATTGCGVRVFISDTRLRGTVPPPEVLNAQATAEAEAAARATPTLSREEERSLDDLIDDLEFCIHHTYLESEHTLRHFRDVGWNPRMFDRTYCDHTADVELGNERMLEEADQAWRSLVARQTPPTHDGAFLSELDRIVRAARRELLADNGN